MTLVPAALGMSGCNNFEDINTDPDKATEVTSAWLATNMLTAVTQSSASRETVFKEPYNLAKYMLWSEREPTLQFNNLGRAGFESKYTPLRNVEQMIEYATDPGQKTSYTALGHFLRAWQFFQVSMRVGDAPYSEAVKGDQGVLKPKYDTQKAIFMGIIDELDKADAMFGEGDSFDGDFIFKGDCDKWRRVVNSFELYVLINLYKKTSDTNLDVINKFKEVASRPLMSSYKDNFALTFTETKGYTYPWSSTPAQINPYVKTTMLSSYFVDMLKQNEDRRLFYVAQPSERLVDEDVSPSDFNAFEGVDPGIAFSETMEFYNAKEYSDLNYRYVDFASPEPLGFLCHWDVQFILAEAAVRGWIAGPADDYYSAGIKSSMNFYAEYGKAAADGGYTQGVVLDQPYIDAYPATVALDGTNEEQIGQIICQKYLAGFFQNEYFAWFEFRRTGYPEFTVNPASNQNPTDNTKFPTRWLYPQNEVDFNQDNLKEAVQRQYDGSDDHNGMMWILQ
jgi:hypothetical protein